MLLPIISEKHTPYGSRVLLRTSFNVPIQDGVPAGLFRVRSSLPTIQYLVDKDCRITLLSHLSDDSASLKPLIKELSAHIPISFFPELTGEDVYNARDALEPGGVLLLENTRKDSREKKNDTLFAEELAANTDLFVFDDFSAAHRLHASTVGVMEYLPSYSGLLMYNELTAMLRITERLNKPALAVLSGAKCETKLPIIEKLTKIYDTVFVGGVIANTLLQHRGYAVGSSRTSDMDIPRSIIDNSAIVLPVDVMVTKNFSSNRSVPVEEIESDDIIVDIGDRTRERIVSAVKQVNTVIMNGPTGWYEKGFTNQTLLIAKAMMESDAYTFVGGGDIVTLLEHNTLLGDFSFVSTGGGSLLAYLADGTLPVVEELRKHAVSV